MNWTVMTARLRGQVVVIDLAWANSEREADDLSTLIVPLLEQGFRKFLLNLVRIRYLDSSDLGALIRVSTTVTRNGGKLSLLDPPGRVTPLPEIARLAAMFDVFTSEDEAVRSSDGLRGRATVLNETRLATDEAGMRPHQC